MRLVFLLLLLTFMWTSWAKPHQEATYALYTTAEESQAPIPFLLGRTLESRTIYFPFQFDSLLVGPSDEGFHQVFPVAGGHRIEYHRRLYLSEFPDRFRPAGRAELGDFGVYQINANIIYRNASMPTYYDLYDLQQVYLANKSTSARYSIILLGSVILLSVLIVLFFYRFRLKRILK